MARASIVREGEGDAGASGGPYVAPRATSAGRRARTPLGLTSSEPPGAIPRARAVTAGSLMGTKTILNELIAYLDLSKLPADALDPRSRLIMLYAMCGFANFASLGIMIGGLGTMAPQRREEINALGLKSIVSGTITTCLMGAVVGVLT